MRFRSAGVLRSVILPSRIALEQISGQDLGDLFQTWLFTPGKPVLAATPVAARSAATTSVHRAPVAARSLLQRYGAGVGQLTR
ncbi:MAG: hypothetical protein ABI862_16680 [Ilumatobacteraceae bacterium]